MNKTKEKKTSRVDGIHRNQVKCNAVAKAPECTKRITMKMRPPRILRAWEHRTGGYDLARIAEHCKDLSTSEVKLQQMDDPRARRNTGKPAKVVGERRLKGHALIQNLCMYIYINQIIDIDYYILNAHMYRVVFFSFSSLFMLVSPSERCSHLGVEATVGKPSLGTVASFHRERRCQRSHSRQLCPTNPERSA